MTEEILVERDVDRLSGMVVGDRPEFAVAGADEAPERPDLGDRLSGVLTLVRQAVQDAEQGGDGGDALAGAVTLMRRQLQDDDEEG